MEPILPAKHDAIAMPVVIDTGCSISITPLLQDFVTPLQDATVQELTGITDTAKVEGIGWVEWPIRDQNGVIALIWTRA